MIKKINDVSLKEIENQNEKMWFSVIKNIAQKVDFGHIELVLSVKNGKITNIGENSKRNWNIGG